MEQHEMDSGLHVVPDPVTWIAVELQTNSRTLQINIRGGSLERVRAGNESGVDFRFFRSLYPSNVHIQCRNYYALQL